MRSIPLLLLITILSGCSDGSSKTDREANPNKQPSSKDFTLTVINGRLPLRLSEFNFDERNSEIHLNDGIDSKIKNVVNAYVNDLSAYDSTLTYHDVYINAIRLQDSLQTLFLVLLKHYPTNEINSKVLFYDNQKKEFAEGVFDFNLWALYDLDNGKLISGKLKSQFKVNAPEIEVIDFNRDGVNDYKFVRLWHNGTFNAMHTHILTIRNNKIDTLFFDEAPLSKKF